MTDALYTAINESMTAYRQVLGEFAALRDLSLSSSPEAIAANAASLKLRLEEACQAHLAVDTALVDASDQPTDALQMWRELVKQVDDENRLLSTRFRGMMSVIADELSRIKGGKSALKGYKSGRDTKGGRLKGAF